MWRNLVYDQDGEIADPAIINENEILIEKQA